MIALATVGLVSCGDDDEAQSLTITASGSTTAPRLALPATAEPGLAEITFDNKTRGDNDVQLILVEGKHSAQEVVKAIGSASRSGPFPPWFFAGGGTSAQANQTSTVTQVLKPGTYYGVSVGADAPPKPGALSAMEVSGEESDAELPGTDATVTAIDYGYETEGELKAGENEITFENTGAEPHHLLALRLQDGSTSEDAEKFFESDASGKGPFAGDADDAVSTAILEGGTSQNVTIELKEPGTYALYCFISDRQGGPPHALKGMVDDVEVK